ncbi:unnamed protein product, partial [Symbiodinium microadriaticum]
MTLIADWNQDVEDAFHRRIEAKTNEELRKVIRNLNDFIFELSDNFEKLQAEHESVKKGSKWFDTWKECSSFNTDVDLKAGMCWEDKEAVEGKMTAAKQEMLRIIATHESTVETMNQTLKDIAADFEKQKSQLDEEIYAQNLQIKERDLKIEHFSELANKEAENR